MYPSLGGCEPPPRLQLLLRAEYSRLLSFLRRPCAVLIALDATSDGNAVIKADIIVNSRALAWAAGVQGYRVSRRV